MKSKRLAELDSLRGISALLVLIFHYFYRYNEIYGHSNLSTNWTRHGEIGVDLFFIISGFVIFWTLNNTKKTSDFIVSRFSRLYPAFWFAVLLTFTFTTVFGLEGREVSLQEAFLNSIMFHEYFGVQHVDGVYWTLTVELTFYFWIFALYLTSNLKKTEIIFSIVTITSILHSLNLISIPKPAYKILIMEHIPLFLAGISFYKIKNREFNIKTLLSITTSFIGIIIIKSSAEASIYIAIYSIFLLSIKGYLKILRNKVLVFLGSISYSLYLIHQNIGYIIINKGYEQGAHPIISILVASIISIIIAYFSFKYVEKPALKTMRDWHFKKNR